MFVTNKRALTIIHTISFAIQEFGIAQNLHGATYTVDVELTADSLVPMSNWVIDIGAFSDMLSTVLKKYNFQNLNEIFPNENTTTEFMCKIIHADLCQCLKQNFFRGRCQVKLHESHKAWASYTAPVQSVE